MNNRGAKVLSRQADKLRSAHEYIGLAVINCDDFDLSASDSDTIASIALTVEAATARLEAIIAAAGNSQ